jgi:pilus assembly protein CpaB
MLGSRPFLIALAFSLLAVASLGMYTKQLRAEISGGEKVSILILSKAVKRAAPLTDDDLGVREVPSAYVDDRFVRASEKAKVLGLKLDRPLEAQQLLEWNDLALAGKANRHLSQLLDPGARALTLHVPQQYMSVELIRPGDYVDLLGVLDEKRGTQEAVVLLQKVLVLAVGVETTPTREVKSNGDQDQLLTVSVTLQDSQAIALALQKGPIIAVLRSPEDPSVASKIPSVSRITVREPAPPPPTTPTSTKPLKLVAANQP